MFRFIHIFLMVVLIAGCGFRPMYNGDDIDIYVAPISGVNGIDLRNELNVHFGGVHDDSAQYILTVDLSEPVTQYKALEPTGDASWQEISIRASYKLSRDGIVVASGTETASESYTFVRYLVASNASYNNAVKNTIKVLGNKISARAITGTYAENQTVGANDK